MERKTLGGDLGVPYGVWKTEAERVATHEAIYGAGSPLPSRGYRVRQGRFGSMDSSSTALLLILGAGALILILGGKK